MNYESMSDFEINKAVAKGIGLDTGWQAGNKIGIADGSPTGRYVDYCNNPSDAWPIILRNEVGITFGSELKSAVSISNGALIQVTGDNPLRLAMIVFLKMNEDK